MIRSTNPILKTSLILFFEAIAFANLASAETALTDQDRAGIVGEYKFEGIFNKKKLTIHLTVARDKNGDLLGTQNVKNHYEPRLTKSQSKFTNYRRLTAEEWINQWKVSTLPGERCDQDRHCFVADQEYTWTWNNGLENTTRNKRIMQFTLDYSEVQNFTVEKKGLSGGLSAPYTKVSVSQPALSQPAQKEQNKEQGDPIASDTSELKKKLLELKELVDEGLISQDDYEKAKNQLLEKM
jgi:hypothetical protein